MEDAVRETRRQKLAKPDTNSERNRLRKAQHDARVAKETVEREAEGTARARAVLREAADAAAALTAAEAAYRASTSEWVAQGAHGDTIGNPELLTLAEAARVRAYRARLAAEAVKEALQQRGDYTGLVFDELGNVAGKRGGEPLAGTMTAAERAAREALGNAEAEARLAVWPIVLAEVHPKMLRALTLHAELCELLPDLAGFRRLCQHNLNWKGSYGEFMSAYNMITSLPTFTEHESVRGMYPYRNFGDRLQNDPEATFD
jgi:hypothetical protein